MNDHREYINFVYAAVSQHNAVAVEEQQLEQSPEAVLFVEGGKLDSLGLVSVIIAIEENLEKELGLAVTIADERALTKDPSPFSTLGALAEYIEELVLDAEQK